MDCRSFLGNEVLANRCAIRFAEAAEISLDYAINLIIWVWLVKRGKSSYGKRD